MTAARACRACGVVAPGLIGPCPACGHGRDARRVALSVAGAAALALTTWGLVTIAATLSRPEVPPIRVTGEGFGLAPGGRGTDAWATLDNPTDGPLDVTVRVRGYDMSGRVVTEHLDGPHRNVQPGVPLPIRVNIPATPLTRVTIEPVEAKPSGR